VPAVEVLKLATSAWTVPAGASAPGDVASFSTSAAGTYSVIVTDANSCASASGAGTLTVNQNPTVTVNSPTSCASSLPATMTATPAGGSGGYHYAWTVPADASAPGDVASFSTSTAGTYSVIVTDASSCASASGAGTLTVNANPTVSLALNLDCEDQGGQQITQLVASPSSGGSYSYSWTGPDGVIKDENNQDITGPAITPTKPGIYTVLVTNTDTGCSVSGSYKLCFTGSQIANQGAAAIPMQQPLSDSSSTVSASTQPKGFRAYLARVFSIFG
jgi:hypothetical protein